MQTLAYRGGKPIITSPIRWRNSLSEAAIGRLLGYLSNTHGSNLSGYLAGSERGGVGVQKLETIWSQMFGATHTIACNSATSAILAAVAVLKPKTVHIPVMGMSAIAAAPMILGVNIIFYDVDEYYGLKMDSWDYVQPGDVILAVNLFGHPADLVNLRAFADRHKTYLIEDNAQGLAATIDKMYCGTIGHIGVWSGNVHKPLNVGEMGLLTTNDGAIAAELRGFINHGEAHGGRPGLNLRLPELTAVLALGQLQEAFKIVKRSGKIRHGLSDQDFDKIFQIPKEREGCISAWYCMPIMTPSKAIRDQAVEMLRAEGLPCRAGYVRIDQMPAFERYGAFAPDVPNADRASDQMILVELCSLDPTDTQIYQISWALCAVAEELGNGDQVRSRDQRQPRRKARTRPAAHPRSKKARGRTKVSVLPS
jgi:perosamine synthetase